MSEQKELFERCPNCNGDGYTSEHANTPHEFGCDGACPVQEQCERCQAKGFILYVPSPTPEKEEIGEQTAWSLKQIVSKLCDATDILLHEKDYDGHGHEELQVCLTLGKRYIEEQSLQSSPTQSNGEIRIDKNTTVNIEKFIEDQKKKINPSYAETIGTESYERRILVSIVEALTESRKQMEEDVKRWHDACLEYEEREASVCPEDVSFEEVIKQLQSKIKLLKKTMWTEKDLEYAYNHRNPKTLFAEGLVETFRKHEEFQNWLTEYKQKKEGI